VREGEAAAAAAILGIAATEFWREPVGALGRRHSRDLSAPQRVLRRLRRKLEAFDPALVYVPHARELHPDHRAAARLARRALGRRAAAQMLMYEIWTPLSAFHIAVDISSHIETKLEAIRAYRSQCATVKFDEAFSGLARYRGEIFDRPAQYAEVFLRPHRVLAEGSSARGRAAAHAFRAPAAPEQDDAIRSVPVDTG
jgi:LmbE family N-acetylglucosaminyl deacetylase